MRVYRNDAISLDGVARLKPDRIVISPGSGTSAQAGVSLDVIREFAGKTPLLSICLGHQTIGKAFGGQSGMASDGPGQASAPPLQAQR